MIGYIYFGRFVVNVCFKMYGYISMIYVVFFFVDFKLGYYMKIFLCVMFYV